MNVDFEFATRDDCLALMVPSDLRQLVAERDSFKAEVERLKKEVSFWQCGGCESCENSGENDECNYSGVCCEDRRNGFILKEE